MKIKKLLKEAFTEVSVHIMRHRYEVGKVYNIAAHTGGRLTANSSFQLLRLLGVREFCIREYSLLNKMHFFTAYMELIYTLDLEE